jgi:hypothetical protein
VKQRAHNHAATDRERVLDARAYMHAYASRHARSHMCTHMSSSSEQVHVHVHVHVPDRTGGTARAQHAARVLCARARASTVHRARTVRVCAARARRARPVRARERVRRLRAGRARVRRSPARGGTPGRSRTPCERSSRGSSTARELASADGGARGHETGPPTPSPFMIDFASGYASHARHRARERYARVLPRGPRASVTAARSPGSSPGRRRPPPVAALSGSPAGARFPHLYACAGARRPRSRTSGVAHCVIVSPTAVEMTARAVIVLVAVVAVGLLARGGARGR